LEKNGWSSSSETQEEKREEKEKKQSMLWRTYGADNTFSGDAALVQHAGTAASTASEPVVVVVVVAVVCGAAAEPAAHDAPRHKASVGEHGGNVGLREAAAADAAASGGLNFPSRLGVEVVLRVTNHSPNLFFFFIFFSKKKRII
jgi:hypothetical protein